MGDVKRVYATTLFARNAKELGIPAYKAKALYHKVAESIQEELKAGHRVVLSDLLSLGTTVKPAGKYYDVRSKTYKEHGEYRRVKVILSPKLKAVVKGDDA